MHCSRLETSAYSSSSSATSLRAYGGYRRARPTRNLRTWSSGLSFISHFFLSPSPFSHPLLSFRLPHHPLSPPSLSTFSLSTPSPPSLCTLSLHPPSVPCLTTLYLHPPSPYACPPPRLPPAHAFRASSTQSLTLLPSSLDAPQASFDPLGTWLYAKGYCAPYDPAVDGACEVDNRCNVDEGWQCVSPETQYLYALYWSIATVTSIGYGDIVATPLHTVEQVVCVCMMLIGSLLFAYLVGSFCGLAGNLSPDVMRFRQDLTDLNKFLSTANIPNSLRYELREYMHHGQALRRAQTAKRLLGDFAPKLRNEVALQLNEKWLRRVALLNNECEDGVVLELAFALKLHIFPPGDSCPVGSIYIVTRGAALFAGRAYVSGGSWGEADALLETDRLRFPIPAWAISYLFAYSIDGESLRNTMSQAKYPEAGTRMRAKQVSWIVRRGIVRMAEEKLASLEIASPTNRVTKRKQHRGSLMVNRTTQRRPSSMLAAVASCALEQKQASRRFGRASKERLKSPARISNADIQHVDSSVHSVSPVSIPPERVKAIMRETTRHSRCEVKFGGAEGSADPVKGTCLQDSTSFSQGSKPTPLHTVPRNGLPSDSPNGASVASSESYVTAQDDNELRRVAGEVRVMQQGMANMHASISELRTDQRRDMGTVQALLKQVLAAQGGQLKGQLGPLSV